MPGVKEPDLVLAVTASDEDHRALQEILASSGWRTQHCRTYEQALRMVGRASVVICDPEAAESCWRDILERVCALSGAPVIVFSRLADVDLWGEVLHLGAFDLVGKPFRSEELMNVLKMASAKGGGGRIYEDAATEDLSSATGSRMVNVEPLPGSLST